MSKQFMKITYTVLQVLELAMIPTLAGNLDWLGGGCQTFMVMGLCPGLEKT